MSWTAGLGLGWEAGDLHFGLRSHAALMLGLSKRLPLSRTQTEGVPVRLGVAESVDLGVGLPGF